MATIKSFTDLSQSKTLSKILPLESADMYRVFENNAETRVYFGKTPTAYFVSKPCWSLAALLNILAKIASKIDDDGIANLSSFMGKWSVNMFDCPVEVTGNYDNSVDACVEMIEKLHELKML